VAGNDSGQLHGRVVAHRDAGAEPRARGEAVGLGSLLSPTRTAAAPSEIWLELPAVTTPSPPGLKTVFKEAIFSASTTPRMPSSLVSSIGLPSASRPAVESISAFLFSRAASLARRWLSAARASTSSRVMLHCSAIRSALSPW
jgi:hypothetical protein